MVAKESGRAELAGRVRGVAILLSLPVIAFSFGLKLASLASETGVGTWAAQTVVALLDEGVAQAEPAPAPEALAQLGQALQPSVEPGVEPSSEVEPGPRADTIETAIEPAVGGVSPLPEVDRARLLSSPIDRPPAYLDGVTPDHHGKHFIASDEWNHHLYAPHIRNLGGGYIGVGATQGYVLIGWARPELAWFIDYDDTVVDLHQVWRVLFELAPTRAELARLWSWEAREQTSAAIREHLGPAEARSVVATYRRHRARISKRMTELRAKHLELRVASYLTDDETFDYVRGMVVGGRVRAMRVDLTATRGLAGIAEVARELEVPIRLLYTSNAQTYWRYAEGNFVANVRGLPFDEGSLVAHTIGTHSTNGDYRYVLHRGLDFQAKLGEGPRSVYRITPWRRPGQGAGIGVERVGFEG